MPGAEVAAVGQVGRAFLWDDAVAQRDELDRGAGKAVRIDRAARDGPAAFAGQIVADELLEQLSTGCIGQWCAGIRPILQRNERVPARAARFHAPERFILAYR